MSAKVIESSFGIFEGKPVTKYTISSSDGLQVSIINYGATITNILMPDKEGIPADIVLGFENLEGYINASGVYMGSICGRYANRIANGKFSINNTVYQLSKNDGNNMLHGGFKGFDKVYWNASILPEKDGVVFSYLSKDGEEGFPGNLSVSVTYRLINEELHIEYNATTDKATPVNLTSHCYFNLSGNKEENIFNHDLQINATFFLETDDALIPTGKSGATKNTKNDFTTPQNLGELINQNQEYDNCWVLNKQEDDIVKAATLLHKKSGRMVTVCTTSPGLQFYSGNFLDGTLKNTKNAKQYNKYAGLCLEAQHFPDSPNNKHFPNTILEPGNVYHQKTIYSFHQST